MRQPRSPRARRGLTLVEVMVALGILGGVMLGLGMFSVRLSQATSAARLRITAAQLVSERLEVVKGVAHYTTVDSMVATEATIFNNPGYTRQTWVARVGGLPADTIDYKIVTVQVTNAQMTSSVRKTTIIAPF